MKIISLLTLCLMLSHALAQEAEAPNNYAVQFYGKDNAKGYPEYWPKAVDSLGTNTVAPKDWFFITEADFQKLISTNQAAMTAAKSNNTYLAAQSVKSNLDALVVAYSNLQWCADNWSSVTNIATLRIAVKAECDVLLKLKPVLQQLYQGK